MNYYYVPKVANPARAGRYRPDIPADMSWVGHDCGNGYFFICTNDIIKGVTPLSGLELQAMCSTVQLSYDDVLTWFVL